MGDPRLHTRFCDLVGVRHPIVQTGMGWVAGSRLTAATARAGGLGIIAAAPMTFEQMVVAIDEVRGRGLGVSGIPAGADATTTVEVLEVGGAPQARAVDAATHAAVARDGLEVDAVAFAKGRLARVKPFQPAVEMCVSVFHLCLSRGLHCFEHGVARDSGQSLTGT